MEVINQPNTPRGAAAAAADAGSPLKISLFSLGNMCAHRSCADALLQLGIGGSLSRLSALPDATVRKYIERIQVSQSASILQGMALVQTTMKLFDEQSAVNAGQAACSSAATIAPFYMRYSI